MKKNDLISYCYCILYIGYLYLVETNYNSTDQLLLVSPVLMQVAHVHHSHALEDGNYVVQYLNLFLDEN